MFSESPTNMSDSEKWCSLSPISRNQVSSKGAALDDRALSLIRPGEGDQRGFVDHSGLRLRELLCRCENNKTEANQAQIVLDPLTEAPRDAQINYRLNELFYSRLEL